MAEVATAKEKKNTGYWINSAIVFALMFIIAQLPPFGQVTPMGMRILGVFVGVLYGWCTVGLIWPSLLGMAAIGTTGYCTVGEAFSAGFGDSTVLMIIVVMVLSAYLEECGLNRYIANWFISRKIGEGRPWVFTCLLILAGYLMSAFISGFATIFILWGIFYNICEIIGEERRTKYTGMMIACIVMTCIIAGGFIFPFKPMVLVLSGLAQKGTGAALEIDFVPWVAYNAVLTLTVIGGLLLVGRFIVRPDVTKVKEAGKSFAHLRGQKMDKEQKIGTVILAVFILGVMLPGLLPKTFPGMALLKSWSVVGVGTVCMMFVAMGRRKDGSAYINPVHLIKKGVNWELVILLAATMPLSGALEAEEGGVMTTVIGALTNTFSSFTATAFMVGFVALFVIVTQFTHNLILMLVLTPVLAQIGMTLGANPLMIIIFVNYAAGCAYLTPAASANAALIFGNKEWVAPKDAYFWGAAMMVIVFLVLTVIGIPLGNMML